MGDGVGGWVGGGGRAGGGEGRGAGAQPRGGRGAREGWSWLYARQRLRLLVAAGFDPTGLVFSGAERCKRRCLPARCSPSPAARCTA